MSDTDPRDSSSSNGEETPPRKRGAHLPKIARLGGRAVVEKYGPDYMASLGKRGAKSMVEKYGEGVYAQLGARNKGVKKRRRTSGTEAEG